MNCSDRVVGRFFRPKLWPVLLLIAGIVILVSTEYYNYVKSGQLSGVQTKNQAVELEYLQKPYLEANSDKRLKIIEKIFYPQIMKFMSDSEGNFSGEGWPLAEASCLYIVRRGRVRNRIGFDPSAFLPKDWEQHFFAALHKGSPIFENKSGYFYPRPIQYGDFMAFAGLFKPLIISGERFVFYFVRKEADILFFLAHSSAISNKDLKMILERGLGKPESELLLWSGRFVSLLIFCFAVLWGICQNRNSFINRIFWVSGALFLSSNLFFSQWFIDYVFSTKRAIMKNVAEEFQREVRHIEEKLPAFLDAEAKSVLDLYARDPDLEQTFWPSKLMRFRAGMQGVEIQLPSDMKRLVVHMVESVASRILVSHPAFPGFTDSQAEKLFHKGFTSKDQKIWEKALRIDSEKEVERSMVFRPELSNEFRLYQIGHNGYYWLWHYDGKEEPRVFLAIYDQADLCFDYLQKMLLSRQESGLERFRLLFHEEGGQARFLAVSDEDLSTGDRKEAFRVLSDRFFRQHKIHLDGGDWFCLSAESALLGYQVMGFLDLAEEYAPLNGVWRQFLLVQSIFVVMIVMVFLLLTGVCSRPLRILQNGFQKLIDGHYEVNIPCNLEDERGVCLHSFNFMAHELREREKILPFVANQVLKLFATEEGGYCDFVQDSACVIFSDIRSFTTISEQYEPEKIVEMLNEYFTLWQSVVERYDGIIERFIGDAVVIIFFRRFSDNYISSAVHAAQELMQSVTDFNKQREMKGLFTISNGIGIACGEVGFSVLGNERRRHFFAMGEAMEMAEKLEAATKAGRFTRIFVEEAVVENLSGCEFEFVETVGLSERPFKQIFELRGFLTQVD